MGDEQVESAAQGGDAAPFQALVISTARTGACGAGGKRPRPRRELGDATAAHAAISYAGADRYRPHASGHDLKIQSQEGTCTARATMRA